MPVVEGPHQPLQAAALYVFRAKNDPVCKQRLNLVKIIAWFSRVECDRLGDVYLMAMLESPQAASHFPSFKE